MLLNEGLLKSSRPVKDPRSTGTHKTQTVPGWRMGSCSGGGMKNGYRQENRKADRQTANAKDRQNGEKRVVAGLQWLMIVYWQTTPFLLICISALTWLICRKKACKNLQTHCNVGNTLFPWNFPVQMWIDIYDIECFGLFTFFIIY